MVSFEAIILNIVLNAIPVLLISIPLIFIRKGIAGKVYKRIVLGVVFFFLVYFVLPVIFQIGDPDTIDHGSTDIGLGLSYMFSRTVSLIVNYFQLPLMNFPFIFIVAPFISLMFLWIRIRKEEGESFREKLNNVTFEYKRSPKEIIVENLKSGDWTEEKQLFKLLMVLLPISLYLLTTILKIAGLPIANIQDDTTAMGWFIEVFFAYLAAFLLGIHLMKAGSTSYEGRIIGEKLESDTYSSLISVGAPISILSILLFLAEYAESFTLVLYFFGYFLMAAFIFVSYLGIFEPICTLIFIKIVNRLKKPTEQERSERTNETSTETTNYLFPVLFGALSGLILLIIGSIMSVAASYIAAPVEVNDLVSEAAFSLTQTLTSALSLEITQIVYNFGYIGLTILIGSLLAFTLNNTKKLGLSNLLFIASFIMIAVFIPNLSQYVFGATNQWITGKLVTTDVFSDTYVIYTLRTAFLNATFDSNVLYYLAIPYQVSRYLTAYAFLGTLFYYVRQNFYTKSIRRETHVDEITYSRVKLMPLKEDFLTLNYLITTTEEVELPETEREEIKNLYKQFKSGKATYQIRTDDEAENSRLFTTLKYMTKNKWIKWWIPEFNFTFERAELNTLYIMYSDGRDVFTHQFSESKGETDPALVAGMFSAITSFIRETTKSSEYLRSIDHGDSKITIEYGDYVFGAIFSNIQTAEIRSKLKNFVQAFENRYGEYLKKWNGNTSPFLTGDELIDEVFEE